MGILVNGWGDDEPEVSSDHAPGNEVYSDGRVKLVGVKNFGGGVDEGGDDTTARKKNSCVGQPEYTIRGEGCWRRSISIRVIRSDDGRYFHRHVSRCQAPRGRGERVEKTTSRVKGGPTCRSKSISLGELPHARE